MATVTTAERIAEAHRLRASGLLLREIAERLGCALTTAHRYLVDPDLSRQRERRAGYAGVCDICGGPTDGSDGPGHASRRCRSCIDWPPDRIIDAMRRWADEHGGVPPTTTEWRRAQPGYPSADCVVSRMGWNAALLGAGFALRSDRRPETWDAMLAAVRAGERTDQIADRFGVTANAISMRFQVRGMSIREERARAARDRRG